MGRHEQPRNRRMIFVVIITFDGELIEQHAIILAIILNLGPPVHLPIRLKQLKESSIVLLRTAFFILKLKFGSDSSANLTIDWSQLPIINKRFVFKQNRRQAWSGTKEGRVHMTWSRKTHFWVLHPLLIPIFNYYYTRPSQPSRLRPWRIPDSHLSSPWPAMMNRRLSLRRLRRNLRYPEVSLRTSKSRNWLPISEDLSSESTIWFHSQVEYLYDVSPRLGIALLPLRGAGEMWEFGRVLWVDASSP